MSQNEYRDMLAKQKSLIQDEYYFKYIFKKTEKIVCAVFYILQHIKDFERNKELVADVKVYCTEVLSFVADSLAVPVDSADEVAEVLSLKLVSLESQLRVLHAAGVLQTDHLQVFVAEIDSTLRSAKSYGWTTSVSKPLASHDAPARTAVRKEESSQRTATVEKTHEDRRTRIMGVLKAQPGASIKDIVDTVKDCSEKTVQRELNTLIKDGLVVREGERRWSKYRVL